MVNSKEYLRNKSCITDGDMVFIDLIDLMNYTKLVQLDTMLDFLENNYSEAYGMINTIKLEIRAIMKDLEVSKEDTNTMNY